MSASDALDRAALSWGSKTLPHPRRIEPIKVNGELRIHDLELARRLGLRSSGKFAGL